MLWFFFNIRQSSIPAKVAITDQKDLPKVGALGEAQPGSSYSLDKSMILLGDVVKVFALANHDAFVLVGVALLDGAGLVCRRGITLCTSLAYMAGLINHYDVK